MTITYKDFEIEAKKDSYDLYHIRPPKQHHWTKNFENNRKVSLGYFKSIEYCVKSLIRVDMSTNDETVDLQNFLKRYKSLKDDLLSKIS